MGEAATFVVFGLGPIGSGLMLCEAAASGRFGRLVAADVDAELVEALRAAGGNIAINIARRDRIDQARISAVEALNPRKPGDRRRLVEAVAQASEIATALPSVAAYDGDDASPAALVAQALLERRRVVPAVLYTAENDNHAAEAFAARLRHRGAEPLAHGLEPLNTVIGKMSGVAGADEIERLGLAPLCPGVRKAVLVEEFNRILISRVTLPGFVRRIEVFREKDDLLPFEEAKLYGHNAVHAMLGYLAARKGYVTMDQAGRDAGLMAAARAAFLGECGVGLIHRNGRTGDELFTPAGFVAYADDLLVRMVSPTLRDRVDRVTRDHARKLAYGDRFFGAMRLALAAGAAPAGLARGAAAALVAMEPGLTPPDVGGALGRLWGNCADADAPRLIELTAQALGQMVS
jgi:mannitol-1-phosphate 5-dehydrogenase